MVCLKILIGHTFLKFEFLSYLKGFQYVSEHTQLFINKNS